MSGRGGSGSFDSGRTAGYAIGEERTSTWLESIAGIHQGSSNRIPGWAPTSPCRLPHVGSPDPLRGDGADFGSGLHRQCTATQAHTLPSVSKCVWRDTVRQRKIVLGLGLGLGVSEYIDIFSAFPKVVH